MTSQWGYPDGMSPEGGGFSRGKTIPPMGILHQGIPTEMSYLFYYTEQTSIW